jgi:hypothetical protein
LKFSVSREERKRGREEERKRGREEEFNAKARRSLRDAEVKH